MRSNCFVKRIMAVILIVTVLVSVVSLVGCAEKHRSKTAYECFGDTYFTLHDYSGMKDKDFGELFDKLSSRLEYYGRLFDIYFEYSGINNLRTINLSAGEPVEVAPEIIELIEHSLKMYSLTEGEVNIALGAVLSLWHEARADKKEPPTYSELLKAMEHCDINDIRIDKQTSEVMLLDAEMSLDVGAVAKGFAVEKLAEYASELGAKSLVIDVGGNIRTVGKHPKENGWTVYIQNPTTQTGENESIKDVVGAVVTSGDYQRYYIYKGKKYHHIIDKDTLYPSEYFSSVTVVCESSGVADALSTALFCMSYESGVELVRDIPEVSGAVWIAPTGDILKYDRP